MIERLNFYDVYGYVIPGFAFVALYWLPFGLVGRGWPTSEWASAVAALATSYVAGFLLQRIGTKALSSETMNGRYPSSAMLDDPQSVLKGGFSKTFWNELRRIIQNDFGLDIAIETRRADAFFACRAALLANERGQYCEQFQGLYAMSRGLLFAFGAAAPYYLGWWLSTILDWSTWASVGQRLFWLLCIPIAFAISKNPDWMRLFSVKVYLFFLPTGFNACILGFCGAGADIGASHGKTLFTCAIGAALSCVLFRRAYQDYTKDFAKQVYTDYYAMRKLPASSPTN